MKKKSKFLLGVSLFLSVCVLFCTVYVNDYYRADANAMAAFSPSATVERQLIGENTIVYTPEAPRCGLIFYPGGKVEYTAYEPLMQACAAEGILCALVHMPFNLAVLDVGAAEGLQAYYPEIEDWYIGGHSLGGAMAASFLAETTEYYQGLVLLAAYSTTDLSDSGLDVLSVYGSEDQVLDREKYGKYKENLPEHFTELILPGGCHAYFGMYGPQEGDGVPTLSNPEQIFLTAGAIAELTLS